MNNMLLRGFLFFLFSVTLCAQVISQIDSLKTVLNADLTYDDRVATLERVIIKSRNSADSIIKYSKDLLTYSRKDDHKSLAYGYFYLAQALKQKGNYEKSVENAFKSLEHGEIIGEDVRETESLLATLFGRIGDMKKSSLYFHNVLGKATPETHPGYLITMNNNFGEAFYQNEFYDSAYYYFQKSHELADSEGYVSLVSFLKGNLGMVNLRIGKLDAAEEQLSIALESLQSGQNLDAKLTFESLLAEVYMEKGDLDKAIKQILKVIDQAEKSDYKEQIRNAYELLSIMYERTHDYQKSLEAFKEYIVMADSIEDIETVRKIGDMQTEFEVGQKQAELDLVNAERDKERLITIGISLLAAVLLILGLVILKYYRQKTKTNEELERLNQTKDKFFSIISHDLRGPVSSFFGISRMIKSLVNRQQTEQLLAIADDIDESVDRLSALLDNLLNWAMQQQGHFPNVPEKVDLNEVTLDLISTLETMAKGKQIDLQAQIEQPIHLWVDKNTTMTILRNLVNNALKFTSDGGSVTIAASKNADQAVIEVIDSGVGIPQEKLKNLFQLQDKKSTYGTSGEKGLGLGLQLVYEFVEMNGGKIEVSSQELVGTTFTVTLPLYDLEEEVIAT